MRLAKSHFSSFSWRSGLSKDILSAGRPFVPNYIGFINVRTPSKDILQRALSYEASRIRRPITKQGTRDKPRLAVTWSTNQNTSCRPCLGISQC
ncbi:uncharacterized protein BCR38DRAFT_495166 [Pseudomassariella vexata]|uniref:Uncharacterized protein n=1 Tax=Pseudomassariella vexata TaxID=1141098 RepID=A0A1Y2DQJ2_9PEZI|nr:uncharacterized protein BCR38DRAFT_495166 [Pseudomassariella vexata]ORY61562.1 hypothetical protein BCR38DRAFT_495166 [Pseudomassariella vexata]